MAQLPNPEMYSPAVLEELQSDRDLFDGVIPDLPTPQSNGTHFALGSCQYPGGLVDEAVAYTSYRDLAQRLGADDGSPRFVVLTGDQVYTDATAGVFDPSMADGRYTLPYKRWLRSRAVRTSLRQAHSFMLLDDHEIENDWEQLNTGDVFDEAIGSYAKYQRVGAWSTQLYFNFVFDDFRFFMLDTRTRRESRDLTNIDSADFLDGQGFGTQLADLIDWLPGSPVPDNADRPIFIASPSMLLPRHREATRWNARASALHSDGWDGYPASLHKVLVAVARSSAEHVIFLSGDEHIGCIATITIKDLSDNSEKTIHSIHTPGLYTPYTFINSGAMDWRPDTGHKFTVGGDDFEYTVSYTAYPGEGFAYINVEKAANGWQLSCQFSDGPVIPVF